MSLVKNILTIFVLGILGIIVFTPSLALAQVSGLNECCKIGAKFSVELKESSGVRKISFDSGCWVGEAGNYCNISDTNQVFPSGDNVGSTATCPVTGTVVYYSNEAWGIVCLLNTLYTITNWLFYFLTIIVVFMVIYGGFLNITAAGDPAKASKGRQVLVYAVIGLAIVLVARMIPSVVKFIVGV